MALVKSSKIAGAAKPRTPHAAPASSPSTDNGPAANGTRHAKASERVAAATEQLAAGLAEASSAAEELRSAMEQIAGGAEQATDASQQQLAAIKNAVARLGAARGQSEASRRRTQSAQLALASTGAQITASVQAIDKNAERQQTSVATIAELDRRATEIGEITRAVSGIADQTNLLALNAAIEAARAGEHGRGFAVVAEEVRALAEVSDSSARDVQRLAETIQSKLRDVVQTVRATAARAVAEAADGVAVVATLDHMRTDMQLLSDGSADILAATTEAERAASQAQRSAEQIAVTAKAQATAASEAQTAVGQQAKSLDQGQTAAQSLAALTEELRTGRARSGAAEQVSATAEELSATVQELSSAATEIMAAAEQISRGAQLQAASTHQTSAALAQMEAGAGVIRSSADLANQRVQAFGAALAGSRTAIEGLAGGVRRALDDTTASLAVIRELEAVGRRIGKIVDAIALVAVQTGMLAVSGAVEAARAGGAGRGFAVVSADIRSLAREASESADRIKDTVDGIFEQIRTVRGDLEQVVALAAVEAQKNRAVADALGAMQDEVAALAGNNAAILQDAGAMLAAGTEVSAGARQIAAAAEEASAASTEAAAAAAEQARAAEDLAAAVEEIALLADELRHSNA